MAKTQLVIEVIDKASGEIHKIEGTLKGAGRTFDSAGRQMSSLDRAIERQSNLTNRLVNDYTRFLGVIGAAGFGVASQAAIRAFSQQEQALAQLNTTLNSTGNVIGQTSKQLQDYATQLQNTTTFGDEAITGAQSLLLTFTNIRETFNDATVATLNVAQAMGTDLKSAALQVGKALNDPIQGLTALSRSGIQFSESQEATIKNFVEQNRLAEAQKVILGELTTQFGGSAAAAASTYTGELIQLNNRAGDQAEIFGRELIPVQVEFKRAIVDSTQALTDLFGQEPGQLVTGFFVLQNAVGKFIASTQFALNLLQAGARSATEPALKGFFAADEAFGAGLDSALQLLLNPGQAIAGRLDDVATGIRQGAGFGELLRRSLGLDFNGDVVRKDVEQAMKSLGIAGGESFSDGFEQQMQQLRDVFRELDLLQDEQLDRALQRINNVGGSGAGRAIGDPTGASDAERIAKATETAANAVLRATESMRAARLAQTVPGLLALQNEQIEGASKLLDTGKINALQFAAFRFEIEKTTADKISDVQRGILSTWAKAAADREKMDIEAINRIIEAERRLDDFRKSTVADIEAFRLNDPALDPSFRRLFTDSDRQRALDEQIQTILGNAQAERDRITQLALFDALPHDVASERLSQIDRGAMADVAQATEQFDLAFGTFGDGARLALDRFTEFQTSAAAGFDFMTGSINNFSQSAAAAFTDFIFGASSGEEAAKKFFATVVQQGVTALTTLIVIKTIAFLLDGLFPGSGRAFESITRPAVSPSIEPSAQGGPFQILHDGGIVEPPSRPIVGLRHDETPIIALAGERVLSREQNREFERSQNGPVEARTDILALPVLIDELGERLLNGRKFQEGTVRVLKERGLFAR